MPEQRDVFEKLDGGLRRLLRIGRGDSAGGGDAQRAIASGWRKSRRWSDPASEATEEDRRRCAACSSWRAAGCFRMRRWAP